MSDRRAKYKMVVLGDSAVGKTSLIKRFIETRFAADYRSTIGVDIVTKDLQLDDQFLTTLSVWDIGGQARFSFVRTTFYKGASGALLVFDVARKGTIASIKKWMNDILQNAGNISVLLVGNKIDLTNEREVSTETGQKLADELGIPYIETSAKSGENVSEAFKKLALMIRDQIATKLTTEEFKEFQRKEGIFELQEIPHKIAEADKLVEASSYFEAAEVYRHIADSYRLERNIKDQSGQDKNTLNAMKYYTLSAEIYLKTKKYTEAAWSFEHLRSLQESSGQIKESIKSFISAAENYERAGNIAGAAWRYSAIAKVYESDFDFDNALKFYTMSWESYLKAKEFSLIIEPIQKLSLFHERKNGIAKIQQIWKESIAKAVRALDYFWAGQLLEFYINSYCPPEEKEGQFERLLEIYQKAANKFEKGGDQSLMAQSLLLAAKIANMLNKSDEAVKFYEIILKYYIESKIWPQAARISTILGRYEDAINFYKKEVEDNKNSFYEPYLKIAMGEYFVISKQQEDAIANFRSASSKIKRLLDAEKVEWKRDELAYLANWTDGRILFQQGVKFSEIDNHIRAQEMYRTAGEKFESGLSEKVSEERRNLLRSFINLCYGLIAFEEMQKLIAAGDTETAKKQRKIFNFNLNYAHANFSRAGQFNISKLINSILEAVESNEFSKVKSQASGIFPSFQPVSTQKLSKLGLANTYLTCQINEVKPLQIELNGSCAISVKIEINDTFFRDASEKWLPLLITCSDTLFSSINIPLTLTEQVSKYDYIFNPRFLESGETTIKIIIKDIDQTFLLKSLESSPVKVLRKYIPMTINLNIENEGETIHTGCNLSGPITQQIKPVKLAIKVSDISKFSLNAEKIALEEKEPTAAFKNLGKNLYDSLIPASISQEIQKAIQFASKQNVPIYFLINSSRELMSIPFELFFSDNKPIEGFFAMKYSFFRYPIEKKVTPIEKLTSRIARVLLISANPIGGEFNLAGVDRENKTIRTILSKIGIQATSITSEASTLQNVLHELLTNEYDAIHFSGHGSFDAENPMESGLVLGIQGKPPEILSALNIRDLLKETSLKLIFLNSCYSAAQSNQLLSQKDVLGIADAFIQVGVPTIIGMQWPVSDEGAVVIARNFYELVFKKNLDSQTALKVARLQLISDFPNDPSWACPMLIKHPSL